MDVIHVLRQAVHSVDVAVLWYFLALNSAYALLIALSVPEMFKQWQEATNDDLERSMRSDALPPISVLMPAYNMEMNIVASVRAQLTLRYPHHEVIVINDGSTDDTIGRLIQEFDLYEVPPAIPRRLPTSHVRGYYRSRKAPDLLVVDKENGGKADALNAGISAARFPLVVCADADTMIAADALLRLARPFLLGDPVVASGGTIRIANGCQIQHARVTGPRMPKSWLAALQVPEYLRAFLFGRVGWNRVGGNLIISGAFGIFRRDYLIDIGGYNTGSVVEDFDLIIRLHRHMRELGIPYSIPLIPDPVAWTEAPPDFKTLARQRERWHRGLIVAMATHRDMLFRPRYGPIGFVHIPFFILGEMLAPVVELTGYLFTIIGIAIGAISWAFAGVFLLAALGYGLMLTLWAIVLEQATFRMYRRPADFARLLLCTLLEPLGYRQLTVLWRLKGFWNAWRGTESWGEMKRYGFETAET